MTSLLFAMLLAVVPSDWLAKREMLTHEAERLRDAYRVHVASDEAAAMDVMLPIDTYENGSVKLIVDAKKAQIFTKEDFILAWDVTIRKLDENGEELSRIEAATCIVDRSTKSGWAEGAIKIANEKTSFSGENVYFSAIEGYVMSFAKSKLVSTDMKLGGVL